MDFAVSFPARGVILMKSRELFRGRRHPDLPTLPGVRLPGQGGLEGRDPGDRGRTAVLPRDAPPEPCRQPGRLVPRPAVEATTNGHVHGTNGYANGHATAMPTGTQRPLQRGSREARRADGHAARRSAAISGRQGPMRRRDREGVVRYFRHDTVVTGWEVKQESPGRLKLKNPVLYRKAELCQAIERELMSVLGIDKYKTSSLTCTVVIDYDPQRADQGPGDRDPRLGPGQRRAPDQARQARPPPAALHGLAAAGGGRPVRLPAAAAGGGGGVRLHVDPDVQGGPARPVRGEAAGRRRPRRDRGGRLPGDDVDLPGRGALLVPRASAGSWSSGPRTTRRSCS